MHNLNTAKISSRSRLLDLVDKELLIEILKAFTRATGLTANIVDVKGRSIFNKKMPRKIVLFVSSFGS